MIAWDDRDRGVAWHLELERELLLPGRLTSGRLRIVAERTIRARRLLVTLTAVERWKHRVTTTDAQGHTTTRVVASHHDVITVPVIVAEPVDLAAGATLEREFELPVPPLGPASLEADVVRLEWTVRAGLDIEGGFDSDIGRPVRVAQPTALLRVGAVRLGAFALYEGADVAASEVGGTVLLEPMPLVCGEPFGGSVAIRAAGLGRLQEIRAELRLNVQATVNGGEHEEITVWAGRLSEAAELAPDSQLRIEGRLPPTALPTIELPHGRTDATFHVILATALARDPHLVRDVAIATTREI